MRISIRARQQGGQWLVTVRGRTAAGRRGVSREVVREIADIPEAVERRKVALQGRLGVTGA